MTHYEIRLPSDSVLTFVGQAVTRTCEAVGLVIGLQTTLASYPDCVHCHWKQAQKRGTLEVTYWPEKNRLWISVHANRSADWTDPAALVIAASLQARLGAVSIEEG